MKPDETNFYDNARAACARKGTTVTAALRAIGRSTSSTGSWAAGKWPGLDIAVELADYLGISVDELALGDVSSRPDTLVRLSSSQREWLSIIAQIPDDRQEICKEFLRTHAVAPRKFVDKRSVS